MAGTNVTIASAGVRIVPDTKDVLKNLRADLERIERQVELRIPVVLDTVGVAQEARRAVSVIESSVGSVDLDTEVDSRGASREVSRLVRRLSGETIRLDVDVRGVGALARTGGIAMLTGALAGATQQVAALVGALGQLSGAVGLLPAAGAAGAAAIGTLVVGMRGFGDALSSMDDPAAFAEALENLAPSAQDAARSIQALAPAFRSLRLDVQQQLFAGMGDAINAVGSTYLPVLRSGMTGIASEMNSLGRAFTAFALDAQTVADTGTVFDNTREALSRLTGAVGPFMGALRDVGTVGSTFLPQLSDGLASAATRLGDFVARARETGQLAEWIQTGIDATKNLGGTLANVGSIFGSIFSAANANGTNLLSVLNSATGAAADFLRSAEGSRVLQDIFGGLQAAASGLGPVFRELGAALSSSIGPAIAQLGPQIGNAFRALAPAIQPLGQALAALAPVVGTIAQALGGALASAVQALAPIITAIAPPLTQIASILGQTLVTAINAAAPLLAWLGQIVGQFLATATPIIQQLAVSIGQYLAQAFAVWTPLLQAVIPPLMQLLQAILPLVPPILDLATTIASLLIPVIQALLPVVSGVFSAITGVVSGAVETIRGLIDIVVGVLTGDWSRAWDGAKSVVSGVWGAIKSVVSGAIGTVKSVVSAGLSAVAGFFRDAWNAAKDAVASGITNIVNFVRELPGKILSALGNVGNLLVQSGKSLIEGFISGIRSMINRAVDAAKSLLGSIRNLFPFSPAKEGPFSGRGYTTHSGRALIEDFAGGMMSAEPLATRAASRVLGRVAGVFGPATLSGVPAAAASGTVINVYAAQDWSPESVASAIDRRLAMMRGVM